jgi:hypothetical protein
MAEESPLEKGVKEETKTLEKKKEKGLFRKAFDLAWAGTYAAGATALSMATVGTLGVMIGGALGAGTFFGSLARGKDSFYETVRKSIKNYGIVNTVIAPMVKLGDLTYPIVGKAGAAVAGGIGSVVAKSAYALTGYNLAFNTLFKGSEHLIDNYLNPKGMVKSIKKDFKETVLRVGKVFAPGYLLAANGIPAIAGIPSFALNAFPAGFYNNYRPVGEKKKEYTPQVNPQTAGATA